MVHLFSNSLAKEVIEKNFKQLFSFRTSADAVMKASGLRIEAIRAIAREQGIDVKSSDSRCIDENLLSQLADAHVRQLKSYFNNVKRHSTELSGAELMTFIEFCKTFKKHQTCQSASSWNDIDTNIIREQFIQKVHSLTQCRELPGQLDGIMFFEIRRQSHSYNTDLETELRRHKEDSIIKRVIKSCWLHLCQTQNCTYSLDRRDKVFRVTVSSRYYVFPDDEYHIAC